ncbi:MAG: hypothetical protein RR393_07995 [Bacteroidales bacterium]
MKKFKWIILIGGALVFYYYYKKKKTKVDDMEPPPTITTTELSPKDNLPVLKKYTKEWWLAVFKSYPGIADTNPEQQEVLAEEHFLRLEEFFPEKIKK